MIPDDDADLEARIDRCLKDLPNLAAPPGLIARTLNALAQPAPSPWYARPWVEWPVAARATVLVLTLAAVAAGVAGWRAVAPGLSAVVVPPVNHAMAVGAGVWRALGALAAAVPVVAQHFGSGIMFACLVVGAIAYTSCIGFGTLVVRFAFARERKYHL
jgi:hypothetical protein